MIIIRKISPTAFLVHGSYGPFLRMNRSGFSKRGNACAVYIYNNNHRRRISYGNRMTGFFTSLFEIKTCNHHLTLTILPYILLLNIRQETSIFLRTTRRTARLEFSTGIITCKTIPNVVKKYPT